MSALVPPDWGTIAPASVTVRVGEWHGLPWFIVRCPGPSGRAGRPGSEKVLERVLAREGTPVDLAIERKPWASRGSLPARVRIDETPHSWRPMFEAGAFEALRGMCSTAKLVELVADGLTYLDGVDDGDPAAGLVGFDDDGEPCALLVGFGCWAPGQDDDR